MPTKCILRSFPLNWSNFPKEVYSSLLEGISLAASRERRLEWELVLVFNMSTCTSLFCVVPLATTLLGRRGAASCTGCITALKQPFTESSHFSSTVIFSSKDIFFFFKLILQIKKKILLKCIMEEKTLYNSFWLNLCVKPHLAFHTTNCLQCSIMPHKEINFL